MNAFCNLQVDFRINMFGTHFLIIHYTLHIELSIEKVIMQMYLLYIHFEEALHSSLFTLQFGRFYIFCSCYSISFCQRRRQLMSFLFHTYFSDSREAEKTEGPTQHPISSTRKPTK